MIPRFISVWNAFYKKHYIQWVSDWLGRYRLSPSHCSIIIIVHVDNIIPCFGNECFVRYTINGICNESVSVAHSITKLKGERNFMSIIHSNIHGIIKSVQKIIPIQSYYDIWMKYINHSILVHAVWSNVCILILMFYVSLESIHIISRTNIL